MTEPGAVERVPLKVVPYFVQETEPEPEPEIVVEEEPTRRRRPFVGIGSLVLAFLSVVLTVCGIVVASGSDFVAGTVLAYAAIGTGILAIIAALVALIGGLGRRWAVAGLIIAIVTNPLVLLYALQFVNGLRVGV